MGENNNWGGARENSGGVRVGAGRKKGSIKSGEHKTGRIVVSCLESEVLKIKELAAKSGKNVSRYLVDLALSQE